MHYKIIWRESPWLLNMLITGDLEADGYAAMTQDLLRYLDGADGTLYWIIDMRDSGPEQGHPVSPEVLLQMQNSAPLRHKNAGQLVIVGSSTFIRFLTMVMIQSEANQRVDGIPLRTYETIEEAEQFCRDVAEVDKRRATHCTPTPVV